MGISLRYHEVERSYCINVGYEFLGIRTVLVLRSALSRIVLCHLSLGSKAYVFRLQSTSGGTHCRLAGYRTQPLHSECECFRTYSYICNAVPVRYARKYSLPRHVTGASNLPRKSAACKRLMGNPARRMMFRRASRAFALLATSLSYVSNSHRQTPKLGLMLSLCSDGRPLSCHLRQNLRKARAASFALVIEETDG